MFGREAEVAELHARLSAAPGAAVALVNSGAVLAGQGGIGKTTLARHYIATHGSDYDGILWTPAATRQNLIDGLCATAPALGLPAPAQPHEAEAKATAAAIASRIAQTGRPWLIVCDNLEARGDLDGLLPPGARVLVTTRQGTGWSGWAAIKTEVLDFATPDAPPCAC